MAADKQSRAARATTTLAFLFNPDATALLTLAVGLVSACLFDLTGNADDLTYPSEVEMEAAMYYGPRLPSPESAVASASTTESDAASAPTGTSISMSSPQMHSFGEGGIFAARSKLDIAIQTGFSPCRLFWRTLKLTGLPSFTKIRTSLRCQPLIFKLP